MQLTPTLAALLKSKQLSFAALDYVIKPPQSITVNLMCVSTEWLQ